MQADQSEPPDHQLLLTIKEEHNSLEMVETAWKTLYARHAEFLYRCLLKEKAKLDRFGVDLEEIVFQTFDKVYRTKAKSFRPGSYANIEAARNHVTSWLIEIAKNLLVDAVRRPKSVSAAFVETTEPNNSLSKAESVDAVDEHVELHMCIRSVLTDNQQDVLWFFMEHYSSETGMSHPPKEVLAEFATQMNSSSVALRKAYERIKKKLKESLKPVYK